MELIGKSIMNRKNFGECINSQKLYADMNTAVSIKFMYTPSISLFKGEGAGGEFL